MGHEKHYLWHLAKMSSFQNWPNVIVCSCQGFQNWIGLGGWTMKTENRDENRFFKPKEMDFLLIPWTPKTGVRPHEPVRTMQSNPLAIKKKKP